jgi:hypothetical protein
MDVRYLARRIVAAAPLVGGSVLERLVGIIRTQRLKEALLIEKRFRKRKHDPL